MHTILSTCINSLHSIAGDTHHSASPIGLWLLLATSASATEKGSIERTRAEKVLGMPVEQAMAVVEELLTPEKEDNDSLFSEVDQELTGDPFDELSIVDVLFEYDGPRIFIAKDKTDNLFLANQVDEDETTDTFLYVPVSRKRVRAICRGDITLREAFTESETGTVYQIVFDNVAKDIKETRVLPLKDTDLQESYLPGPTARIDGSELAEEYAAFPRQNSDAVRTAMASWVRGSNLKDLHKWAKTMGVGTIPYEPEEDLYAWLRALPSIIEHGPLPTNEEANAWVAEKTDGMIESLPLEITGETFMVLLSAIVAKTRWVNPLREITNHDYLGGAFKNATKVLVSASEHHVFVKDTDIGKVGVHVAKGDNGLDVYSVIADPKYDYRDVIRVAHEISVQDISDDMGIPLAQLQVDASGLYEVHTINSPNGDQAVAYLPKWKTETSLKGLQNHPDLGFGDIASAISERGRLNPADTQAIVQQDVVAEYTATGFQAAAVTQMNMMTRCAMPDYDKALKLLIEFNHPYAVVAIVRDDSIWSGTPVFSSWVKTPV